MSTSKNIENLLKALICQLGYPPRLDQGDLDPKFLDWLAQVYVSEEFYDTYENSSDLEIAVASHPNTSKKTLLYLAKKANCRVMLEIAKHPKLNHQIARELLAMVGIKYPNEEYILVALAENPMAPSSVLAKLAEVASKRVQSAVVKHPQTPQRALLGLVRNPCEMIRVEAAKRIAA